MRGFLIEFLRGSCGFCMMTALVNAVLWKLMYSTVFFGEYRAWVVFAFLFLFFASLFACVLAMTWRYDHHQCWDHAEKVRHEHDGTVYRCGVCGSMTWVSDYEKDVNVWIRK